MFFYSRGAAHGDFVSTEEAGILTWHRLSSIGGYRK